MARGIGKGWHYESRRHALASKGIHTARQIIDNPYFHNLKMNPETYKMRRDVINVIYEIKQFDPDIPRVEVRITDTMQKRVNEKGCGFQPLASAWTNKSKMDKCVIWVSKEGVAHSDLRTLVYHEVLHTIYGVPHIEGNKLMNPSIVKDVPKSEAQQIYLELKDKYGGK